MMTSLKGENNNCRSRYLLFVETSKLWTVIYVYLSRLGVPSAFASHGDPKSST